MKTSFSRRSFLAASFASGALAHTAVSAPTSKPARRPGQRHDVPPKMSFIANDRIKLGVDLSLGGAITHVSPADDESKNLINSYDLGRQVQMSYYSGPAPYSVPGHQGPPPEWNHIGWNPIQVGDCYGNPSKILEHRNDGKSLYVKCQPMQWALDDVPGECTFEVWIDLEGAAARVRSRINMTRADKTQWRARLQELPAVYTNGKWHKLMTYTGDRPFTNDKLTSISHPFTMQSPWAHWQGTERWAAQVDDNDWGLGVWSPETTHFGGGFAGKKGAGGPKDGPTGYIAPHRAEILDHNAVHEFRYALVLGDLTSIRKWVYDQPLRPTPPDWRFEKDRQGWTYHDAADAGWPIAGTLDVRVTGRDPQLLSPPTAWFAADADVVEIELSGSTGITGLEVFWSGHQDRNFSATQRRQGALADGAKVCRIPLAGDRYAGLITQLRIDPLGKPDGRVSIHRIRVMKS